MRRCKKLIDLSVRRRNYIAADFKNPKTEDWRRFQGLKDIGWWPAGEMRPGDKSLDFDVLVWPEVTKEEQEAGLGLKWHSFEFLTYREFHQKYTAIKGFNKDSRSKWGYWFAHWCAFQLTAISLHCWKPKYLLHDIEKPFMLSLTRDYDKVQKWHRYHNKHHTEYALYKDGGAPDFGKVDWEGAVIDWECSALTKAQALMNARETLEWLVGHSPWKEHEKTIRSYCEPVLDRLGL